MRYTCAVTVTDPLTEWALSPGERAVVQEVYLRGRTLAETAVTLRTDVAVLSRTLQSAFRLIAATETTYGRAHTDPAGPAASFGALTA